jgi:hypothetical protein
LAAQHANDCYKRVRLLRPEERPNSHQKATLITAKKLLRKAQRQLAAKKRKDKLSSLMEACQRKDEETFYKLIRDQRQTHQTSSAIDFGSLASNENDAESWANYFAQLASPKDNPLYDGNYQRHLKLTNLLQALLSHGPEPTPVSNADIMTHIKTLKNRKAPDTFGISSEHLKYSSPVIADILCHLVNKIFSSGCIPENFKAGCISPVLKRGKTPKDPNHYRRITITSIVGKVVEKEMLKRLRLVVNSSQSPHQFGFTNGVSPMYAALVVTEMLSDAKDDQRDLFITFMDTSKAFDVVDHKGMLNSLYKQGIQGPLWTLFSNMYTDIHSLVKWGGQRSSPFQELQGIRQGGVSSADCYKAGKNQLLHQLGELSSMRLGHVTAGCVMVADDLALASHSPRSLQIALNFVELDASRERYSFNCDKTKTVAVNVPVVPDFTLNQKNLETSEREAHLGIYRSSKNTNLDTVKDRVQSARRAAYSLMGAGMHGLNGVGTEVAINQYAAYILPILTYGLEALVLNTKELELLELYHRKCLRYIQHLPMSTARSAIHLITGIPPVQALINIQTLKLFRNVISQENDCPPSRYIRELILRQLSTSNLDSSSWTSHVRLLLAKYQLPSAFELLSNLPTRIQWKKTVKRAVYTIWTNNLHDDAQTMSSLKNLHIASCALGVLHPVWQGISRPAEVKHATVKAQLLVGRYPLATTHSYGGKRKLECPLCKTHTETLDHFLLYCPLLMDIRQVYLPQILNSCRLHGIQVDPEQVVQFILDSNLCQTLDMEHERVCRTFVYKMHNRRSQLMC